MALVAYDYSDSGSENESEDDGDKPTSVCELLFSSLPQPKQQTVIVEEDDEILLKPKKNGVKEPVKISIPALSNYNSDEEEPPKKIIIKPQAKATGLFAVLPTPKCVPVDSRNQKFDPSVVKQKNLVPRTVKKAAAAKRHDSDDEDISISGSNFFSFTDTRKIDPTPGVSTSLSLKVDSAKPVKDINSKTNSFFSELVANSVKPAPQPEPEEQEEEETFEKKAVEELCGKRRKKSKKNDINFIDINAADVMPDPREWRTKALTEEQPQPAVKKGEEPSSQSRRKHQITYLAYQAKVNEQELKNQWALNRMTRKQTQAKYGF